MEGETVTLDPIYKNILFLSMLVSAWAFFGWFWTHSGQTGYAGMAPESSDLGR